MCVPPTETQTRNKATGCIIIDSTELREAYDNNTARYLRQRKAISVSAGDCTRVHAGGMVGMGPCHLYCR